VPYRQTFQIVTQLLICKCLVSTAIAAYIPTMEWGLQLGSDADDSGNSTSVDGLGNIYVSGYGFGSGLLVKYDSEGALLWLQQFGSGASESGFDVATDLSGNIFVTGVTTGNYGGPSAGSWDGYVTKFNAAGSVQWVRQFGTSGVDSPYAIATDDLGNAYVAGHTERALGSSSAGGFDAFLTKYDAEGNSIWTRQYGNSLGQTGTSVATDRNGSVYMVGATAGNLGGLSAGGADAFLAKYDGDGNFQWGRQLGTNAYEDAWGVATDRFGSVFILGATEGSLGGTNVGLRDVFLAKYNSFGTLIWTQQWGTVTDEIDSGISVDDAGNIYVTGATHGSLAGGMIGAGDPFVTKFDSMGALIWSWQAGSDQFEAGRGISVDGSGNVYITGETRGGSFMGINAGGQDLFLIKIVEVPEPKSVILMLIGLAAMRCFRRRSTF
jgi:hypothetical protein